MIDCCLSAAVCSVLLLLLLLLTRLHFFGPLVLFSRPFPTFHSIPFQILSVSNFHPIRCEHRQAEQQNTPRRAQLAAEARLSPQFAEWEWTEMLWFNISASKV